MGRKSKKNKNTIDLKKVELTNEEIQLFRKKAARNIALSILWPVTLTLLIPHVKEVTGDILYYIIVALAAINVYITIGTNKIEVDEIKYMAFGFRDKLGKIERFTTIIFIVEIMFVILFAYLNSKMK